jgi:hypothetical protein
LKTYVTNIFQGFFVKKLPIFWIIYLFFASDISVLPELTNFCDYVRAFFGKPWGPSDDDPEEERSQADDLAWSFVGRALMDMTLYFDLSEEVLKNPKGHFKFHPWAPRGEICPLGGMFTTSFTPRG